MLHAQKLIFELRLAKFSKTESVVNRPVFARVKLDWPISVAGKAETALCQLQSGTAVGQANLGEYRLEYSSRAAGG